MDDRAYRATYPNTEMHVSELRPGDTVTPAYAYDRARNAPYDAAVVQKVDERFVYLFRPYVLETDYTTGQVPTVGCTVGVEHYQVERSAGPQMRFYVWSRIPERPPMLASREREEELKASNKALRLRLRELLIGNVICDCHAGGPVNYTRGCFRCREVVAALRDAVRVAE